MSAMIDRLRACIYPHRLEPDRLHASDLLLGMVVVMLAVLGIAYAITIAAAA
jgi:hypothetical protein